VGRKPKPNDIIRREENRGVRGGARRMKEGVNSHIEKSDSIPVGGTASDWGGVGIGDLSCVRSLCRETRGPNRRRKIQHYQRRND